MMKRMPRGAPTGKVGSSATVSKNGVSRAADPPRSNSVPVSYDLPENPAHVGMSISAGMNTDYAKQKLEISAWATLPCDLTPEARSEAYDECHRMVREQLVKRWDEVNKKFFDNIFPPLET